jgi:magnesium transporter
MIRLYQPGQNAVLKASLPLTSHNLTNLAWIDLQDPTIEEIEEVENFCGINIPTRLQQEEIESSSRYTEEDDYIIANSAFLQSVNDEHVEKVHVSFVIKGDQLVTYREGNLNSFAECVKKIKTNYKQFVNGRMVLLALFETRVDFDADMIENFSQKISAIGKQLTNEHGPREELLKQITNYQETAMLFRQNIIDKQRVISSLLRSGEFIDDEKERLRVIIKDIYSLIEHTNFLFERLEYMQNTFLGLINLEQNKIIKIFTLVSVLFIPPLLIVSLYGMNFEFMPELHWKFGYPFAILLMLGSAIFTWYIFKKRKWL